MVREKRGEKGMIRLHAIQFSQTDSIECNGNLKKNLIES